MYTNYKNTISCNSSKCIQITKTRYNVTRENVYKLQKHNIM